MATPDAKYRINPDRAVYITGQLDAALVAKSGPEIQRLRHEAPAEPITVFINSRGGELGVLETIDGLLRAPDQDGRTCRVVTVALGDCASAAATLLSLGDYAIAYPHSRIHFHGSRILVDELTAETAIRRADHLRRLNRRIAMRIAEQLVERMFFRLNQLGREPDLTGEGRKPGNPDLLASLVHLLRGHTSQVGDLLLSRAERHMSRIDSLSKVWNAVRVRSEESMASIDAKILREVLRLNLKRHKDDEWELDEDGLGDLFSDFTLLRDYIVGEHVQHLPHLEQRFGPSLLEQDQFREFQELAQKGDPGLPKWLNHRIGGRIRRFWFFAVCLCRFLQEGENPLSAQDAYWLGLVDEVLGTRLQGLRAVMESGPETETSPTASASP